MEFLEHDSSEPRIDRKFPAPWKLIFPLIAVCAGGLWFTGYQYDFVSICLGLAVGCTVTAWAIEVTGNKVPDSWRSKSGR